MHRPARARSEASRASARGILAEEGEDATAFCINLLKEARISTTPGIAFGPTGQSHLRLSFCVPHEMIDKAFDRIKKFSG